MASNFADELQRKLESKNKLSLNERRVLRILTTKPANALQRRRKERRVAAMENHARAAIGADPKASAIDWSSIDWAALLSTILKVLVQVLPLILALL